MTPAMPLFGDGSVCLQPVWVGDVGEAAARVLADPSTAGQTFELAGPEVLSYREIVRRVAKARGRTVPLVPVPYAAWSAGAAAASLLPEPPFTRGQVALMRSDNIASGDYPGLQTLGIEPTSPTAMLDHRARADTSPA
jgi:NADH dehydrogenase